MHNPGYNLFQLHDRSTDLYWLVHRNRSARLEYRAQSAYIKGSRRRKVGKARQEASEERRRAELSGERM